MVTKSSRAFLEGLFKTAVAAAHPNHCLPPHLPTPPESGQLLILAAGKAAAAMAEVAEKHYVDLGLPANRIGGLAVTRRGYVRPTRYVQVIEAGHPVPDAAGLAATLETLSLADAAGPDDLVVVLISGGASANWIAPARGLALTEKQTLTRALLASGATISEMNTVRKHLSQIKGGRLAERINPARSVTIAISDVPGDEPAVIGSGPTVPDPTTLADARAIVARYRLEVPEAIGKALADPANETPKPGDPVFSNSSFILASRPSDVFGKVEAAVRAAGYECILLGTSVEGEARAVAEEHAHRALALRSQGKRVVVVSGGELTVTMRGKGRGGPNQEYMLALAIALDGAAGIAALAGDTDGIDGGAGGAADPAGAFVDSTTLGRARKLGLDPMTCLNANNSTEFFEKLGDLLTPGPTCTNVSDFRSILVDSP